MRHPLLQRDARALRWLTVFLRGLHLVAIILFCATLLSVQPQAGQPAGGLAVLVTGLALWALDLWRHPAHLRQAVSLCMLLKLLLVAGMILMPTWRLPLMWLIVVWSALFSHAPSSFRNVPLTWPRHPQ
ncbi:MAG: hypothetical protein JO171_03375 [Paludibacterium sp.]|uniref:hypothetical protein n=1 Tax=Paludibacterium sp. TaxID=1917523 RepID=UPI0025EF24E6|nr:hypothetical protein [Paludibacterium sp.]MBV8046166.1 hypothetical protein [Paludibacterium sp.]MBV8648843.1 hypothetical protein [Paludibacterium sp.]